MANTISGGGYQPDINQVDETAQADKKVVDAAAKQEATAKGFQESESELVAGPKADSKSEGKRESQLHALKKPIAGGNVSGVAITAVAEAGEDAEKFQRRNPELLATTLLNLRKLIKEGDSPEQILKMVLDHYPDPTLADEALDFLILTTTGKLQESVKAAKATLTEDKGREIIAGRNIQEEVRKMESEGLGTPTNLRDLYRDITGNPRDAKTLFDELSQKYSYKGLTKVTKFLLHSMGAEMKAKGPSIEHGALHNILREVRTIQAILGVYRFFNNRMPLVRNMMVKIITSART